MDSWKIFMYHHCSANEIDEIWLSKDYEEDHPAVFMKQFKWLEGVGVKDVDVTVKYYHYSVYGAKNNTKCQGSIE